MASPRSLIERLTGRSDGAARPTARTHTRTAPPGAAEAPSELVRPSGNGARGGPPPPRLPSPAGRRKPRLKKLRIAVVVLGLSLLAFVSWIFGIMMAVASDLPQLENRAEFAAAENSVVYDRQGERIATLTNNEGRILVESDEIAPVMKEAVVAIEDQRFYEHRGVDFEAIGRALYQDILSGSAAQGGSTITQQFVKNALAAQQDRTILQKLREAALAYQLEREWDKDKILTEYLNSIYFGEGAYGIEAAAQTYFGWNHPGCGNAGPDRCAYQLLPAEAALLAGMISSPSAYSPRANPEAATARRNLVLQRMAEQGYITEDEYPEYSRIEIPAASQIAPPEEDSAAPYFTSWLRQQLVDKYGAGKAFGGGLKITSTLDLELQQQVEEIVSSRLSGLGITASVVVLDSQDAGVRAMVGGPDFAEAPFNLATQGYRQPGSAFKPFTLVTALSQGISPDTVWSSMPKELPFINQESGQQEFFEVENYEDSYLGSASLATATTYSDNSVYAEVGLEGVDGGPEAIAETAQAMGIESKLSTNPAMILGGLERGVSPLEMAHAFETLETDGQRVSGTLAASPEGPVAIEKVEDADGDLVDTNDGESGENRITYEQVIDPTVAATARSILQTVVSTGTGTNAATGDDEIWGKTGTTDDNGDAWFVGANEDQTIAIWVGHPDSVEPMTTEYAGAPVDGGTFPALIFRDITLAWAELEEERGVDEIEEERQEDGETDTDSYIAPPEDDTYVPEEPATSASTTEDSAPETTTTEEEPVEEEPVEEEPVLETQATESATPSGGGGDETGEVSGGTTGGGGGGTAP
jgi:penicillin-binding protein 1A